MLTELRDANPFSFHYVDVPGTLGEMAERAEQLEARLNQLHDAVEKAIGHLNEVTPADDGTFSDSDHLQEALAALNRVL